MCCTGIGELEYFNMIIPSGELETSYIDLRPRVHRMIPEVSRSVKNKLRDIQSGGTNSETRRTSNIISVGEQKVHRT